MEVAEVTIGKIEQYLGRRATHVLLILIYGAVVAFCLSTIFNSVVLPIYRVWKTPTIVTAINSLDDGVSSPLTTIFISLLLVYFIFVDGPSRRVRQENELLRGIVNDLKALREEAAEATNRVETLPPAP
jgi:hypothetical protein